MDALIELAGQATLDWLLEEENPSVRYETMTELLGMAGTGREVLEARRAVMRRGVVPLILSKQVDGCWGDPDRFYLDKYRGTVWQLLVLAELHASGDEPGIAGACEFILDRSQDRESHGFSVYASHSKGGGRPGEVIPCLTGNLAWALVRLGFGHDPRVAQAVDWIIRYQRFDDGIETAPSGWPYDRYEMCWGRHSCHMGAAKALKALAELPPDGRPAGAEETIGRGVEYFLRHHVFRKSHDLDSVSKPGWLKPGFPLMYQTDVLEILGVLTSLGCRDSRMEEAVGIVESRRGPDGRWKLENSFNGKFQVDIESRGKPSKWITLKALEVLKRFRS